MALKIDTNQSATAFHINTGATLFPYAIDAQHAISNHPLEWSDSPWSQADATAARKRIADNAKENGLSPPPEPAPLSPEDQAAIDEHNKAVAEAQDRLNTYYKKKAEDDAVAQQVAADEALVASLPPQPDPTVRRPFGRKGEPTPAEVKMMAERDAKKAAEDKAAKAKSDADKLAGNTNPGIAQPAPATQTLQPATAPILPGPAIT